MSPEDRDKIMTSLTTLMVGQDATNEHLRILNGKVATQEGNINTLMLWKARAEGFTGAINIGWTLILTILSGAVLLIGDFLIRK